MTVSSFPSSSLLEAGQLDALRQAGFSHVPVTREVLADLETPLSAYLKLAHAPYSYLFESVQGGERWGRYSIIGLPARTRLEVRGQQVSVMTDGACVEQHTLADPLAFVQDFQQRYKVALHAELPRFVGGLVGYFAYDCVRYVEKRLAATDKPDPLDMPDILLMLSEDVLVFDNLRGVLHLVTLVALDESDAVSTAASRLQQLEQQLRSTVAAAPAVQQVADATVRFVTSQTDFMRGVERIKDYVLAGDVMQVVPSQRMSVPFTGHPLNLYRALRHLNPSPYMYFLNLDSAHIVGSSPEILARMEDGCVTVRPIAGTRRRGATEAEDKTLEQELLADPKEIAEHLMLIDLGRNDAGRVSTVGGVRVTEKMIVERYSHVMHIVSNVEGRLRDDVSAMDVLRATLPAGTLSGAPKVRAMEIIDELEPVKRGVYGGAVGYLGWNGNMDTAIAIRTAVIKGGQLHVQAGAGVVADSQPQSEWEETLNKGRAILRAVEMVNAGLSLAGEA